jgi:putative hydrolase of the HAD superfamily
VTAEIDTPLRSSFDAVIFDYYGTVAEHDGKGRTLSAVLAERGYHLPPELARYYWQDGIDGKEHLEHSRSREQYQAWRRGWLHQLLGECSVPANEHDEIEATLTDPAARGRMMALPDAHDVLGALADNGIAIAICSNWDWDLHESIAESGLTTKFDVVVSSAWVGARKPHDRIYRHTLAALEVEPERALFVGDTWACDVDGPRRMGMTPLYVRGQHREPDHTAPADVVAGQLVDVLEVVELAARHRRGPR